MAHGHRLGDLVDVLDRQPVARELGAIGDDAQVAEAGDLLDAHIDGAGHLAERAGDALAEERELLEIRPVDDGRHVGADAGHELVGAHLNRLRDAAGHLGHGGLGRLGDLLRQQLLGEAGAPGRAIARA